MQNKVRVDAPDALCERCAQCFEKECRAEGLSTAKAPHLCRILRFTPDYIRAYVQNDPNGTPARRTFQVGDPVWYKGRKWAAQVVSHDRTYVFDRIFVWGAPLHIDTSYTIALDTGATRRLIQAGQLTHRKEARSCDSA